MYASLHIHIYTYFARVCASLCKCMFVWACPTNVALVHFRVFIAHSFNQTCIWFSCSFIHAFICVSTDFCLYESLFCLPSSPVFPYFFFLSFCAPIGISFVQFLTHGQQLQALQTSSSGWNSNSICLPLFASIRIPL